MEPQPTIVMRMSDNRSHSYYGFAGKPYNPVRISMVMRYELLEHTADVMVRCTGDTLAECFENAAYALSDQTVDPSCVDRVVEVPIEVTGDDDESRLYNFLSEVLFIEEAEVFAFSDFKVSIDGDKVSAIGWGEPLDLKRHHPKTEVKAITYHMMHVDPSVPELRVVFDI